MSTCLKWLLAAVLVTTFGFAPVFAQSIEDCIMCHEDEELTKERNGKEVSLFIDLSVYEKTVHGGFDCVDCHQDLSGADFPHDEVLELVDCSMCHDDIASIYDGSLHGKKVREGEPLAPHCWDCHGAHDIFPPSSPISRVTKFNIPYMCGSCHKEGTAVTQKYDIPKDSILTHYSESIHGVGLYQMGLTVTAVCSDCHTAHNVLPHTDPRSSIYRENVPKTCEKCHGQIEEVHRKVIRGEVWRKEPDKVPICVDCHSPHEIRQVFYDEGISNKDCLNCHQKKDLVMVSDGDTVSLYVESEELYGSMHRGVTCAQCHTGASLEHDRPCETVADKVDCSICHAEVEAMYLSGIHGSLAERGDKKAPDCTDCHGVHGVLGKTDDKSPTFPINVPQLCGNCHREGMQASERYANGERDVVEEYSMGIHGKGLLESGLVVTAMCTDCHTAHMELPPSDPRSTVNRDNIAATCATCHNGIYEQFSKSIHSPLVTHTEERLPVCNDCHQSHTIIRADQVGFRLKIMNQCGKCHADVTETYFETFHGKVSKLGYAAAAKCYDCHGAHNILPPVNTHSTLSRQNIVATCAKCHPGSHRQFAGYLTHATHHDRAKYPILFYTFWFMTSLLLGTLIIAGTHTLLWMPKSFQMMREHKALRSKYHGHLEYRRFKPLHSGLHFLVVISFLGLAVTGMTLKFSYLGWARWLSGMLGGFESAGYIHRMCAIITFFYFIAHIVDRIVTKVSSKKSWKDVLTGSNSMLPNKNDWREFKATIKWFFGAGPRPNYGRWTYWEKFDYFAVFWGVAIIGSTGLVLWFPEFFTLFLPGWIINVATIIHSDEALLAVAFIFTVHFFNTHFRPDKFPMDTVIFTGRVPLEELKQDRPGEYRELVESRQIKKHLVEPLPPVLVKFIRVFGSVALFIGLSLIILIIYAEIFGYR
ncbi:MAG: cytochrome c3 family protein [candidate division Zixibacteria bacterium]|nr:cytochrome c3 family protein [candidate division Zixibacteria bacterium]